jgi:toluene monooxygenase system ferredoxin subunit
MAFVRVCSVDDVPVGGMTAFFIDWDVLVVRDSDGDFRAMNGICPHEDFPLAYGLFDGNIITCANHMWTFDAKTGEGINAPGCRLEQYAVKIEDGGVFVDTFAKPGDV